MYAFIVLGELCDFSVATFRQKIERYVEGGGDGGLTKATMRAACGLTFHPDGAGQGAASRSGAGVVETAAARQVTCWLLGDEEGAWRQAGTSARSTTSAGCTRTCGRGCRPGTVRQLKARGW